MTRQRTQEEWIRRYKEKNALWIHDGNLKLPHAKLTSGLHSNGFFNSRLVIPDEDMLGEAADDLIRLLLDTGEIKLKEIDGSSVPRLEQPSWLSF